jgi:aspartyl/asparaginyl beta-hydroxylase (cupin superfamily)
MACRAQKDLTGEIDALQHALTADPHDLMALILRANLLERQGLRHEAAQAYQAVIAVAPALDKLVPDLRPALQHAVDFRDRYQAQFGEFVDKSIAEQGAGMNGAQLDRFRLSLDIEFGRKKRYESRPIGYFFPGLPTIEFFERSDFPWLDQIEAASDAIRDEFLAVLDREQGFSPYITYGSEQPVNQWAELNNSPRWSAFHLLKDGRPVPGNSANCPLTMQALAGAPQPEQAGRTPVAMFSLLKPRTRIPPHVGISNARLVTHLPLIIPEACGFRVGNQTRHWVPGKAWVFDDTIEHEAWNDSDKLRVVLIFDIWHPHLTAAERRLVSAMTIARNEFLGRAGEFDL